MDIYPIVLFGEAETGQYRTPYFCESLPQLVDRLGHPPEESRGLHFAVQSLLYDRNLIFFRVQEEGYSHQDYLIGFEILKNVEEIEEVAAICLPGVGSQKIYEAVEPVCKAYKSVIVVTEPDLYDYLTEK